MITMVLETLKKYILETGESQAEIARKVGVNKCLVCRIINGQQDVNTKTIDKFCDFFELELKPKARAKK